MAKKAETGDARRGAAEPSRLLPIVTRETGVTRETDGPTVPSSGCGHVSYSELRQHLSEHLDAVCDSRAPLVITRRNREPVVMLALSEYESLQETLHLLRNLANAEHLLRSIKEAEAGEFATTISAGAEGRG